MILSMLVNHPKVEVLYNPLLDDFEHVAGAYAWNKIPEQDFELKMQGGGFMQEGGFWRICGVLTYLCQF